MHPKRVGDGDAFVGVFLIYGFDFFHEQKQGKAAFGVAVDDGDESRVFAKEQAEVIATDTAIGGIAGFVWPGPFVVKAHDVAVVVQGFAEVADGKVDGGFDEFPDGGVLMRWSNGSGKLGKVAEAGADAVVRVVKETCLEHRSEGECESYQVCVIPGVLRPSGSG